MEIDAWKEDAAASKRQVFAHAKRVLILQPTNAYHT